MSKQFWIHDSYEEVFYEENMPESFKDRKEYIHAIEYSAYELLERKVKVLSEALEEIDDKTCSYVEFTRSALNLIAKTALKEAGEMK